MLSSHLAKRGVWLCRTGTLQQQQRVPAAIKTLSWRMSTRLQFRQQQQHFSTTRQLRSEKEEEVEVEDDGGDMDDGGRGTQLFSDSIVISKLLEHVAEEQFPQDSADILREIKNLPVLDEPIDHRQERRIQNAEKKDDDIIEGFWVEKVGWKPRFAPKMWFFDYEETWKHFQSKQIFKSDIYDYLSLPVNHCEEMQLIDVRSKERRGDFVIPESKSIPLAELAKGALMLSEEEFAMRYEAQIPSRLSNIVCFGDDPHDAEMACKIFSLDGYPFVLNYRGGVQDWFGEEFKVMWVDEGYGKDLEGDMRDELDDDTGEEEEEEEEGETEE